MYILQFPTFLPVVLAYDHYFGAALGVLLNSVVLVGLNLRRSQSLGKYRWFMMAHTFNDLISAITMGMLELCFDYSHGTFIMVVTGPLTDFGTVIGKTCFMIFASCFVQNVELLALTFLYRYLQICKKYCVHHFFERKFVVLLTVLFIAPLIGVDLAMILAYTFSYEFAVSTGDEVYGVRALYVEYLVCPSFLITCTLFISTATVCYIVVFYCCNSIFAALRLVQNNVTEKTRKSQKMLTLVLLLQSITPVLTSSLPACGMIIGILLQWKNVRWITWLMSATFVWLPSLNAIISLTFIAPLRSIFRRKIKVTVTSVTKLNQTPRTPR